jgi:hypothetical protein
MSIDESHSSLQSLPQTKWRIGMYFYPLPRMLYEYSNPMPAMHRETTESYFGPMHDYDEVIVAFYFRHHCEPMWWWWWWRWRRWRRYLASAADIVVVNVQVRNGVDKHVTYHEGHRDYLLVRKRILEFFVHLTHHLYVQR